MRDLISHRFDSQLAIGKVLTQQLRLPEGDFLHRLVSVLVLQSQVQFSLSHPLKNPFHPFQALHPVRSQYQLLKLHQPLV